MSGWCTPPCEHDWRPSLYGLERCEICEVVRLAEKRVNTADAPIESQVQTDMCIRRSSK